MPLQTTFHSFLAAAFMMLVVAQHTAADEKQNKNSVYATAEQAAADPDFKIQGEYAREGQGMQVIALGNGEFSVVLYEGGLPGDGWDRQNKRQLELDSDSVLDLAEDYEKVLRESPTLGNEPPPSAVVLFDGTQASVTDHWKPGARLTDDGLLMEGVTSLDTFQDFTIHLEFRLPYMPLARGQGRGNSGLYYQGRYETQVLDSFGLAGKDNECGGLYSIKAPDLNMCLPPLSWQTYDADFRSARYNEAGEKIENARITVRLNGVIIHNDVELPRITTAAPVQESSEPGPIYLQNHGNPVRYRNIWVVPRDFSSLSARPIVPGFERFHAGLDSDLAAAGRLLMGELGCIACHSANDQARQHLLPKQAPILTNVGSRVSAEYLLDYLQHPHETRPGTTMPDLFAEHDEKERLAQVSAIVHFLVSTGQVSHSPLSLGNVEKGRRLFHEIGCIACHAPQEGDVQTPQATSISLAGIEKKYSIGSLTAFLNNPHAVRPSGRMPNFQLQKTEPLELASYLLREQNPMLVSPRWTYLVYGGRHESLPDVSALQPERTGECGLLDVSLAGRGDNFVIHYRGFLDIQQAGRYVFHLGSDDGSRLTINGTKVVEVDGIHPHTTRAEAVNLEAGLHEVLVEYFEQAGEESLDLKLEGPGIPLQDISPFISLSKERPEPEDDSNRVDSADQFVFDPSQVEKGRALFASVGCANCHEMTINNQRVEPELTNAVPELAQLKNSTATASCLAETALGIPNYHLSPQQQEALTAAVDAGFAGEAPTNSERLKQTMTTFNCYACHARDNIGGPEQARNALFLTTIPEMGDEGRIPPPLDGVADKLTETWLRHVLSNGAKDRPYMKTRMPKFGGQVAELTPVFVALDEQTDAEIPESNESKHRVIAAGRELVGGKALSCIKCHTFGPIKATGIQAIDLLTMTKRLREDWFYRYLQNPIKYRPGTRMPNVFPNGLSAARDIYEGDPELQIFSMWEYLKQGSKAAVPYGLLPDPIELVPDQEPMIYRNFIEGVSPRGIAVGYPEAVNLAYDANEMALRLIWHGPFIDAAKHWRGRGPGNQSPLGDHIIKVETTSPIAQLESLKSPWPTAQAKERGYQFVGYRLNSARRPVFLYQIDNLKVSDTFLPHVRDGQDNDLVRMVTIESGNQQFPQGMYYRAAAGQKIVAEGNNQYRIWYETDGSYLLLIESEHDPTATIRQGQNGFELLLPINATDSKWTISQQMTW